MARVGQARPRLWLTSPASPLPPDTRSSPSISTHRPTSGGTLVTPPAEGTPSPALDYSPRWPGTFRSPRFRTSEPILTSSRAAKELEDWNALANSWRSRGRNPEAALDRALQPLANRYHLILVDCPPGNRELQLLAMHASRYALIPTRPDEASLDGMIRVVLLFGIETRARRIRTEVREQVRDELGDPDLVLTTEIRHLLAPARDSRSRGELVHEYEEAVLAAPRFYEPGGRDGRLATSAPQLAEDYQALTRELLTRMDIAAVQGVPA